MMQSDRQRLLKIIETGTRLLQHVARNQITPEDVRSDYAVQWTITTPLYNIGEHTYQLSKELKAAHPEIPWAQVSGMRHRLVHNYDDTNWEIMNIVIFEELERYIESLKEILATLA